MSLVHIREVGIFENKYKSGLLHYTSMIHPYLRLLDLYFYNPTVFIQNKTVQIHIFRKDCILYVLSTFHLVVIHYNDTQRLGGGRADESLFQNRNITASSPLADSSTDSGEVGDVSWRGWRCSAVQVSKTKNISCATLSRTSAALEELALLEVGWSANGNCGEHGGEGE